MRCSIAASALKTAQLAARRLTYIYHNSNDVKEEGAISRINQEEILRKAVLLGHGTSANSSNQREFAPLRHEGLTHQLIVLPAPKFKRG